MKYLIYRTIISGDFAFRVSLSRIYYRLSFLQNVHQKHTTVKIHENASNILEMMYISETKLFHTVSNAINICINSVIKHSINIVNWIALNHRINHSLPKHSSFTFPIFIIFIDWNYDFHWEWWLYDTLKRRFFHHYWKTEMKSNFQLTERINYNVWNK